MGNGLTNTLDRWGLNAKRFTHKSRKKSTDITVAKQQPLESHIYDVPDEGPVYAQVRKTKKKQTAEMDELHYADLQRLQSHSSTTRGEQSPKKSQTSTRETTEYATIDFASSSGVHSKTKPSVQHPTGQQSSLKTSSQPADIFIPPGALLKPKLASEPCSTHSTQHVLAV